MLWPEQVPRNNSSVHKRTLRSSAHRPSTRSHRHQHTAHPSCRVKLQQLAQPQPHQATHALVTACADHHCFTSTTTLLTRSQPPAPAPAPPHHTNSTTHAHQTPLSTLLLPTGKQSHRFFTHGADRGPSPAALHTAAAGPAHCPPQGRSRLLLQCPLSLPPSSLLGTALCTAAALPAASRLAGVARNGPTMYNHAPYHPPSVLQAPAYCPADRGWPGKQQQLGPAPPQQASSTLSTCHVVTCWLQPQLLSITTGSAEALPASPPHSCQQGPCMPLCPTPVNPTIAAHRCPAAKALGASCSCSGTLTDTAASTRLTSCSRAPRGGYPSSPLKRASPPHLKILLPPSRSPYIDLLLTRCPQSCPPRRCTSAAAAPAGPRWHPSSRGRWPPGK